MNEKGRAIDPGSYSTLGIVLLILGIIGIVFPYFASWVVVTLMSVIMIISGFALVFGTAYVDRRNIWGWLLGLILLIFGFAMLFYPYFGAASIALIMGIFFIISGIGMILFAVAMREYNGWWLGVVSGVLSLILATLVLIGWPESSKWLIGMFLGIELLFDGIALMVMGKVRE